jgi:transposase-like protein
MMLERGLQVDHTTIYRWVQCYAPELDRRCRAHLKMTTDSWRVDETYIKIKKQWVYLYRAVDSRGKTLDFLLSRSRDGEAAKRFFVKVLTASHTRDPRVINVDKHTASPKAFNDLRAEGRLPESCELRQVKYLNNLIEQDHCLIKRLTKPGMGFLVLRRTWLASKPCGLCRSRWVMACLCLPPGARLGRPQPPQGMVATRVGMFNQLRRWTGFFSFETAWRTLQGFEAMNMLRKGQVQGVAKGNASDQAALVATLFGVLA